MTSNLIALSLATGSASFLISSTEISKPVRIWVAIRSRNKFFSWLSRLLQCPYCVSVWLSIFASAAYRPGMVHRFLPLDYLVSVMAISGLSMLPVLWIKKALGK